MSKLDFSTGTLRDPQSKIETRQHVLDLLKTSSFLWSRKSQSLRYDWLELAGLEAPTFQHLLGQNVLKSPSKFIGVDTSMDVIDSCKKKYAAQSDLSSWHQGNIFPLIRTQDERVSRVGVLVWDSFRSVRGRKRDLKNLNDFAVQQSQRLGEFLLILNVSALMRTEKDIENYRNEITSITGIEVSKDSLHRYKSKKSWMVWTALKWGF